MAVCLCVYFSIPLPFKACSMATPSSDTFSLPGPHKSLCHREHFATVPLWFFCALKLTACQILCRMKVCNAEIFARSVLLTVAKLLQFVPAVPSVIGLFSPCVCSCISLSAHASVCACAFICVCGYLHTIQRWPLGILKQRFSHNAFHFRFGINK